MRSLILAVIRRGLRGLAAGLLATLAVRYSSHPLWGPVVTAITLALDKAIRGYKNANTK